MGLLLLKVFLFAFAVEVLPLGEVEREGGVPEGLFEAEESGVMSTPALLLLMLMLLEKEVVTTSSSSVIELRSFFPFPAFMIFKRSPMDVIPDQRREAWMLCI